MSHNSEDSNNIELDRVDERCGECGKRMTNVKYIYVGLEDDAYYCKKCVSEYGMDAVRCMDI